MPAGDELGHRADGLLDRHRRVDAVLVVEVDVVDAEPLQRGVAGRPDVLRAAVDAERRVPSLVALVAELGREHDLVAAAGDRPADEPLVGERAVHVGGVEEGDAEVEGAVDRARSTAASSAGAVELGHAHAAEAEGGDGERGGGAEGALVEGHAPQSTRSPTEFKAQARSRAGRSNRLVAYGPPTWAASASSSAGGPAPGRRTPPRRPAGS